VQGDTSPGINQWRHEAHHIIVLRLMHGAAAVCNLPMINFILRTMCTGFPIGSAVGLGYVILCSTLIQLFLRK
jgi:hypothetical protein